jgi:hypothetical protein
MERRWKEEASEHQRNIGLKINNASTQWQVLTRVYAMGGVLLSFEWVL